MAPPARLPLRPAPRPHATRPATRRGLAALLLVSALGATAPAQLVEDFEGAGSTASGEHGPSGLLAKGWQFRNQSDPASSGDWVRWAFSYQGNWGLHVDWTLTSWQDDQSEGASWAILPAVPGQTAGDELRFFHASTEAPPLVPTAHLEVRYSPSGGTSTGSKPDDVGDFTTLLADLPTTTFPYDEFSTTVPGSGRLALRYHLPPAAEQQSFWGDFHIDLLTVGPAVSGPPIPGPGQVVHWDLGLSPIEITEPLTIPAGGTVIVDPGVSVTMAPNTILTVAGTLSALGTPTSPVHLGGYRITVPGELEVVDGVVDGLVQPDQGGSLSFTDTTFTANGLLTTVTAPTYIWNASPFVELDGCTFDGSYLWVGACTIAVRNTTVQGGGFLSADGYVLLDGVVVDGATNDGLQLNPRLQPFRLDGVTVTNCGNAGIDMAGLQVSVGPDVTLAGNGWPVQIGGAGFEPGSVLPATGNVNDWIRVVTKSVATKGGSTWPDVGLPYVVSGSYKGGAIDMLPGATVQLRADTTFWGDTGPVVARGLPGDPVVFEQFDVGQRWQGLQYFERFEHCVIDGGDIGARFFSASGPGSIDSSTIRNCLFGTQNNVVVRKTLFEGNGTGSWNDTWDDALTGTTGANAFVGNGIGVDGQGGLVDATSNWWGAPSGPSGAQGGSGDSVTAGVSTEPFLTAAPDFSDTPPIVRLEEHSTVLEAGEHVILNWTAQDDVGIVSQRVEFDLPFQPTEVLAVLPPDRRAFDWVVPDVGFIVSCTSPVVRVVAVDTAGQEGWDASEHLVPTGDVPGTLEFSVPPGPYLAGSDIGPLCWTPSGTNPLGYSVSGSLVLDADGVGTGLGGVTSALDCLAGTVGLPFVSTDTARVVLALQDGSCNRVAYFYSDPFEIRPDARLGDAPPSVALLSPSTGAQFAGGGVVPLAWTAADDEAVRSVGIHASYDGGDTWHVVVGDLPGTQTTYDWRLPPTTGIPDVRLRVVAVDERFQNSSDTVTVAFTPGDGSGWLDLGGGVAGSAGVPALSGDGPLTGGSTTSLALTDGLAGAPTWIVLGFSEVSAPLFGGTLVPSPDVVVGPLPLDGNGALGASATWPTGLPSGLQTWWQTWTADAGAAGGYASSNALLATTP